MSFALVFDLGEGRRVEGLFIKEPEIESDAEGFWRALERARERTGMHKFKLAQIWNLVGQCAKLGTGDLIEVGCAGGGSGHLIARRVSSKGIPAVLYLCDTFSGIVKSGAGEHENGTMQVGSKESVREFVEDETVRVIEGVFPEDFKFAAEQKFRFAHLDVDTYRSTRDSFRALWPRMVAGGIVLIDDYGVDDCPGIKNFVQEELDRSDAIWNLGLQQATAFKR